MANVITFLSDFGTRDGYVGAVKGVLFTRCPGVRVVDLTHDLPPGDVAAGAFVLAQSAPWFPPATVHLAVVDPGVGSQRRAVACEIDERLYVAPDNGLLTHVLGSARRSRFHHISESALWAPRVSDVFHGRDVFAPVAAYLSAGGALADVGPVIPQSSLERALWPEVRLDGEIAEGCVVHVDRFGNLVTNLPVNEGTEASGAVRVGGRDVPVRRTYADAAAGELVALRGSSGLLEVACNRGDASRVLEASVGDVVTWRRPPQE